MGLVPTGDPLIIKLNTMITGYGYTTKTFASQAAFDSYIRDTNYESQTKICFGIDVSSSIGNSSTSTELFWAIHIEQN